MKLPIPDKKVEIKEDQIPNLRNMILSKIKNDDGKTQTNVEV